MQQDRSSYKLGVQYEATQEWITQVMGALLSIKNDEALISDQLENDVTLLAEIKRELAVELQSLTNARHVTQEIMSKWKIS